MLRFRLLFAAVAVLQFLVRRHQDHLARLQLGNREIIQRLQLLSRRVELLRDPRHESPLPLYRVLRVCGGGTVPVAVASAMIGRGGASLARAGAVAALSAGTLTVLVFSAESYRPALPASAPPETGQIECQAKKQPCKESGRILSDWSCSVPGSVTSIALVSESLRGTVGNYFAGASALAGGICSTCPGWSRAPFFRLFNLLSATTVVPYLWAMLQSESPWAIV